MFFSCGEKPKEVRAQEEVLSAQSLSVPKDSLSTDLSSSLANKSFTGAFFSVQYPSSFSVSTPYNIPQDRSPINTALFTSSDKKVTFYVFSPQWNGQPDGISKNPESEVLVDSTSEVRNSQRVTRWTLYNQKEKIYKSFEQTDHLEYRTRKVFGIFYTSSEAREEYKEKYLDFKKSLIKYAD